MAFRLPGAPSEQFFTRDGRVLAGGSLTFYVTGTSTLLNTYSDATLSATNTNPVVLDASGRPSSDIWMDGVYRVRLADSAGVEQWVRDTVQGSGDLPDLAGNAGEFLTTDGETLFFAPVTQVPSVTGQSGKVLTNNGVTPYWDNAASALPPQTGNAGAFLTTNGTSASWAQIPLPTGITGVSYVQGNYTAFLSSGDVISPTMTITPVAKATGSNHIELTVSANVGYSGSDSNRGWEVYIERYNGSTWDVVRDLLQFCSVGQVWVSTATWIYSFAASSPAVVKSYRARVSGTDHPDRAQVLFISLVAKSYD